MPLSQEAQEGLRSGQDIIRQTGVAASFPAISSTHLTLKFLGDREQVSRVEEKLEERVRGFEPFILRINGLGAFPSITNPRIAWAGTESDEQLAGLQISVEDAMREIGFAAENRKFSPHITLARIKSARNTDLLGRVIQEKKDFNMGTSPVDSIRLYQSILNPGGAVHKILAEIPSGSWK